MIMDRKICRDHINNLIQVNTLADNILKLLPHLALPFGIFPEKLLDLADHSHTLKLFRRLSVV